MKSPARRSRVGYVRPNRCGVHQQPRLLGLEHLEQRCLLAAGDLDLSFGNAGVALVGFTNAGTPTNDVGRQVEFQQTVDGGKLLIIARRANDHVMFRLNSDGSLDDTFSNTADHATVLSGLITPLGLGSNSDNFPYAVAVDSQHIYVLGRSSAVGVNHPLRVARFDHNGIVDSSFGTNGVADPGLSSRLFFSSNVPADSHIVLTPQGIVVATTADDAAVGKSNPVSLKLTRLAYDGQTIDSSFGVNGVATWSANPAWSDNGYSLSQILRGFEATETGLTALVSVFLRESKSTEPTAMTHWHCTSAKLRKSFYFRSEDQISLTSTWTVD